MRLLLDTHLLVWAATRARVPPEAIRLIEDPANVPVFSVVSLWELTIKRARRPEGYIGDPASLRADLLGNGYEELVISASHVLAVGMLPPVHGDPFDRLLLAQAMAEGMTLLTADATLARYPGPIRRI